MDRLQNLTLLKRAVQERVWCCDLNSKLASLVLTKLVCDEVGHEVKEGVNILILKCVQQSMLRRLELKVRVIHLLVSLAQIQIDRISCLQIIHNLVNIQSFPVRVWVLLFLNPFFRL